MRYNILHVLHPTFSLSRPQQAGNTRHRAARKQNATTRHHTAWVGGSSTCPLLYMRRCALLRSLVDYLLVTQLTAKSEPGILCELRLSSRKVGGEKT